MKKILLYIFFFLINICFAQKELWTYKQTFDVNNFVIGQIIKAPLTGDLQQPEVVHNFNNLARNPQGRLFQASNGKLYGVAGYPYQGQGQDLGAPDGVLFEYDLILNKFNILNNTLIKGPLYGVIEPVPGTLYGFTSFGTQIFKYIIATNTVSVVATMPQGNYGTKTQGELMLASDGNLYFATNKAPTPQGESFPGGIFKLNMLNNQLTLLYIFRFTEINSDIGVPTFGTKLIEGTPGKFYLTTLNGGTHNLPEPFVQQGTGTLYEYTSATNSMLKKYDFDVNTIGGYPTPLMKLDNNKFYGGMYSFNYEGFPSTKYGSIYEYNISSNLLSVLHIVNPFAGETTSFLTGIQIIASDGNIYGVSEQSIYRYNLIDDVLTPKIPVTYFGDTFEVIEICRKPFYNEFTPNTYNPCVNTPFTYDIQNTNATSYVWKKDGVIVPLQTTGILTINNLIASDTGVYTCTMTNECGTTTTMNLNINVNCLNNETFVSDKNEIVLYPNPTKNTISIHLPENETYQIENITITNLLGQKVIENIKNTKNIDVASLQKGIYILQLKTDKGEWNGKFVKE